MPLYYSGMFMVSLLVYIAAVILLIIKKSKLYSLCEKLKNTTILFNALITFILLIPNIFILVTYFDKKPLPFWIIFVNIFSIILMFLISIYNIQNLLRLICSEEELVYQKNYNSTLENLLDGLRTFKHDYNNTLQTLYGYTQLGNLSALKKIFEQILDESKAINSLDKLNPTLINNPSIFGLITAKYQICIKNNVTMNFEIFGDLENLDIQIFDLTRILGIFLDNAIEAASGSKDKKINFLVSESKNSITIEISNTYSDTSITTDTIFEKGISSKGKNRGLGLYEVSKILKKYPNVSLTTIAEGNNFLQKLTIPKFNHN
jgi:two-component system sensor histidine kinase AgrC